MGEDTSLVRKSAAGDASAFEALVRRYARLVWASTAGMARDRSWIEDIVQETFLKAWKSIGQLNDPDAFRAWLLSINRRLIFRHTELQGREIPSQNPGPSTQDPTPDDTNDRVHTAIRALPERYRLPVTLKYINNMPYARITEELQISNGALRGLLNRGVKLLRKELEPFWKERS